MAAETARMPGKGMAATPIATRGLVTKLPIALPTDLNARPTFLRLSTLTGCFQGSFFLRRGILFLKILFHLPFKEGKGVVK
jgi:hypothetical protein